MIRRAVTVSVAVPVIYLLAAIGGALWPAPGARSGDDVTILLAAGPIHYDILLPLDDETRAAFAFAGDAGVGLAHRDAVWLSVGWGSHAFYTQVGSYFDVSPSAVWTAITGDASVLRLVAYPALAAHPKIRAVTLSAEQYASLRSSLRAEFGAAPQQLDIAGLSDADAFFASPRRFDILRTCNTWIARMMSDAGIAFGRWTPTPFSVTLSLRWFGLLADQKGAA